MAIQQHPIPQNVTQFQFRLVGDMTLKQFLQLAGGIVVAVIIYALPLPVFFKWPLIALAAGAGAGMAFLPIEGRPLDQWIVAFIRSIYQPTIYVWQKSSAHPQVSPPKVEGVPHQERGEGVPKHITLTPDVTTHQTVSIPSQSVNPAAVAAPSATLESSQINNSTDQQPKVVPPQSQTVFAAPPGPIHVEKQTPLTTPVDSSINQPTSPAISIPQAPTPAPVPQTPTPTPQLLPIPHPPQTPNTIVGMTLTPGGSILDSAIVEILLNNTTVRATKSNKLGQFLFAKPLDNGVYQITAERTGYKFPIYSLNLTGQVIQPISLKATSESNKQINQ